MANITSPQSSRPSLQPSHEAFQAPCGAAKGPPAPRTQRRAPHVSSRLHAPTTRCPNPRSVRARSYLAAFCLATTALAMGCAHAKVSKVDLVPIVEKQASFELACAPSDLTITELDDNSMSTVAGATNMKTYGVDGCGKRATYVASCTKAMMMSMQCAATQQTAPISTTATPGGG